MEARLFARLWEEVDFDDHPLDGSHNPQPEGDLRVKATPQKIHLEDNRISFIIGTGNDADSIHRWTTQSVKVNEGPDRLGVHRWSISPDCLDPDLAEWVSNKIGPPSEFHGRNMSDSRMLLSEIREEVESLLSGWTWHLEVDNKSDRWGWYVRAPEEWCSLFTLFLGVGWNQHISPRGFLLFERAPPGELDRPDEKEANRLDGLRTVALCNSSRGALSHLAEDMEWANNPKPFPLNFPGNIELWPPSLGRWPLLFARSESMDGIPKWHADIIEMLLPAISTLSTKIDGISWH